MIDIEYMSLIGPEKFVLLVTSLIAIVSLASEAIVHIITRIIDYTSTAFNHLNIKKSDRRFLK